MSDITVIIPTSPIPSHPSTRIIKATIESVREHLPDAPILVTANGIPADSAYLKALRLLVPEESVLLFDAVHQSGMLEMTLQRIQTPLLLYVEHDWRLLPRIPWGPISALIRGGTFNYVKFHAAPRISPYHEHLMRERVIYQGTNCSDRFENLAGEPIGLIKTVQWSQNPHLASTAFYRDKILPLCTGKIDFIENIIHGLVAGSAWEEYRCAIYNPMEGDMMRVYHLDGKGMRC